MRFQKIFSVISSFINLLEMKKLKKMNKLFMFLFVLLAVGLTVSAVSADDGWNFNFFSSESTNSDGGAFSFGDNQKLNIQQLDYYPFKSNQF